MSDDKAKEVCKRWDRLKGDRSTTESHWQEIDEYVLPDRADFLGSRTPGGKRQQKVFDSTGPWALQQAAAGFHGYMVSPTDRWFNLKPDDDRMADDEDAHAWFDAASNALYSDFNSPRLNFATAAHELILDELSIATGCMAVLEQPNGDILYSTRHMNECVFEENEVDRVDGLVRRWTWTAKQASQQWGDKAGEKVLKAMADGKPDTKFPFLHQARPRANRDPQRADRLHKPFESIYVAEADFATIGEGGFDEFPYLCPRFSKRTNEIYGSGSPGWVMLPDLKMSNQMLQTVLIAAQGNVDPALSIPDDYFAVPVRSTPGAKNYHRAGMRDQVQRLFEGGDVRIGVEMLNQVRQSIIRGFYVDWMVMPTDPSDPASAGKGVTATFTSTQRDQNMRLLSPILARQRAEFVGQLISRNFAIRWRQSVALRFGPGSPFPPPPPQIQGMPWRVEYISPAEVAQRSSSLDGLTRLVQTALVLAQVDPTVPNVLNAEGILREAARALNTSAASLRSPEDVAARAQAAAEQQQQAQQLEAVAGVARAAKDGTAAVGSLIGAGGGQQGAAAA